MWGDEGQRRPMLPLRVVHAATADRRSRILDEKDDREPLFYTRHLVVDFKQDAIEAAYAFRGLLVPEVGYELADTAGRVLAEAELAWPGRGVAVLHGEQTAGTAAFEQAGWRVVSMSEDSDVAKRVMNAIAA